MFILLIKHFLQTKFSIAVIIEHPVIPLISLLENVTEAV